MHILLALGNTGKDVSSGGLGIVLGLGLVFIFFFSRKR